MANCDSIISGARVIDGSGGASHIADVAIDRGHIAAIGDGSDWRTDNRVDAAGMALAPGFIDSHTHDDLAALKTPDIPFKISQGVTTVIAGNCGISLAPLQPLDDMPPPFPLLGQADEFRYPTMQAYRDALEKSPCAVNLALLAGHSSLRLGAMTGQLDREADPPELTQMQENLRLALRQGCIGLSTGLDYPPARAASTDEIVQLAGILREFENAVYATHMRDEGDQLIEAVAETLDTGSSAKVPVVISHLKCAGTKNFGRSRQSLEMIERVRERRQPVSFDVYPYTASSTSLLYRFVRNGNSVLVAESKPHPERNGQMLERITADWQCSIEEACDRLYPAAAIYFEMHDDDLERFMRHPAAMIGSDGIPSMLTPHPRLWGTFPRVLGHYVREKKLFDLETAVFKMTGLTARRFGLAQRGEIAIGYHADLVLFDPDTIIDRASFENPVQASQGIVSVWVNGSLGWHDGKSTGNRNGLLLSH